MKKIIGFLSIFFLTSLTVSAQENEVQKENKFFVAFTGGPSFPIGQFGDSKLTETNDEAGFAKTGYNLNLNFGYQATENFGLALSMMYARHQLDMDGIHQIDPTIKADHWQYYGILIGPIVTAPISEKVKLDFKVLGGASNVNFPLISVENLVSSKENWATAFTWQIGTNLRYNFSPNACFISNLDYTYTKPKTTYLIGSNGDSIKEEVQQKMGIVNFTIGIGIRF